MKSKLTWHEAIGTPSKMPLAVKPMLCTLIKEPFQDQRYLYEVKLDGYRIICYKNNKDVKVESRGGLDYTKKYPPIVKALSKLKEDVVLDGEAVVLNKEGKPDFDALQRFNGQQSGVVYYVFDLLWVNGINIMHLPLVTRKHYLCEIIKDHPLIKYSEDFEDGLALFSQVKSIGLEGIVAKRKESKYQPNKRGTDWYKIPYELKQEFVIGGWVESEARHFRTLLFGAYEGKKLKWIGHAGGGYKDRDMPLILQKLKTLEIAKSPFANEVDYDGVAHYVKPELVANIKYAALTRSGKIRKPAIFLGFREDKNPQQVLEEKVEVKEAPPKDKQVNVKTSPDSNWPKVESQKIFNQEEFTIDNCKISLYNVDRELWKGVTKADLIQYYNSISSYILPHLKNRPLSLHIKLKGPFAEGYYIKDMEGRQPSCADIFTTKRLHKKEGMRDTIDYLVCNNLATLLYIVNLGCIDLNPWTSTTSNPIQPTCIVIDLDPSDEDFAKAIETAKAAKEYFDKKKLKAFVKTSGKTGIHIFIPCSGFNFNQARIIAETICDEIHSLVPSITTTEVSISKRGNKLYLDPNQNDYADTVAAPYSVRPAHHPNVSTPIEWNELKNTLSPENFTFRNIEARIKKKGDLFSPILDNSVSQKNNQLLKRLL
jgi:bifunctional non-homologous end joining protein LigD